MVHLSIQGLGWDTPTVYSQEMFDLLNTDAVY